MSATRPLSRALGGAAVLAAVLPVLAGAAEPARHHGLGLHASAVALDAEDPSVGEAGRLVYRGGLSLTAADPRFGGFSGLAVAPDGRRLTAVSDRGMWFTATLRQDARGRLVGADSGALVPMRDRTGAPLRSKRFADAEALEPVRGRLAVAFEHRHRLWLYPDTVDLRRARPLMHHVMPARFVKPRIVGPNQGIEALAALQDGSLLALAEGPDDGAPLRAGWIVGGGRWRALRYRAAVGFRPTGATTMPGGDVLVLERRFSWVGGMAARIVRVPARAIRSGATLSGNEIARLQPPLTVDNFEGIAVRRDRRGRTQVYLISDDNFHILQRTLLMMFELTDDE